MAGTGEALGNKHENKERANEMSKIKSVEVTIKVYYEDGTSEDRAMWCSGYDPKGLEYSFKTEECSAFTNNTVTVNWREWEEHFNER